MSKIPGLYLRSPKISANGEKLLRAAAIIFRVREQKVPEVAQVYLKNLLSSPDLYTETVVRSFLDEIAEDGKKLQKLLEFRILRLIEIEEKISVAKHKDKKYLIQYHYFPMRHEVETIFADFLRKKYDVVSNFVICEASKRISKTAEELKELIIDSILQSFCSYHRGDPKSQTTGHVIQVGPEVNLKSQTTGHVIQVGPEVNLKSQTTGHVIQDDQIQRYLKQLQESTNQPVTLRKILFDLSDYDCFNLAYRYNIHLSLICQKMEKIIGEKFDRVDCPNEIKITYHLWRFYVGILTTDDLGAKIAGLIRKSKTYRMEDLILSPSNRDPGIYIPYTRSNIREIRCDFDLSKFNNLLEDDILNQLEYVKTYMKSADEIIDSIENLIPLLKKSTDKIYDQFSSLKTNYSAQKVALEILNIS